MTWPRLVRSELRKLTTTWMPLAFLAVLVVISATTATAVIFGTDFDGTKGFVSTAADQQSLMAFAANAMMIAGLFGAIAIGREYGHGTVVPTFLASITQSWPRTSPSWSAVASWAWSAPRSRSPPSPCHCRRPSSSSWYRPVM